jgi:hypothetical protein
MNIDSESKSIFPQNQQQSLPYATASLVLGILSIVFCFTYGIVGLIPGIIGLVLAAKDRKLCQSNPEPIVPTAIKIPMLAALVPSSV